MPKFTREQIRKRQRIAAGCLAALLLVLIVGCVSLVRSFTVGPDTPTNHTAATKPLTVREADPDALAVRTSPKGSRALKELPKGTALTGNETMGIDVSNHQGEIDWQKVAEDGYTFAYIKATEGTGYTDPRFNANWEGARAHNITPGAYHYFTLCSPGAQQARDFLAAAPPDDSALPPALDLEFDGACDARPEAEHTQREIDDFLRAVEAAWGRRAVIYSSSEWRGHYGLPQSDLRPDWIYSDSGRPFGDEWSVWQVHFKGKVSGISRSTDIDVLHPTRLREHSALSNDERRALLESIRRSHSN